MQQHPRQSVAIAFAARQNANAFENIVFAEQKTAQQDCATLSVSYGAPRRPNHPALAHSHPALCIDPGRNSPRPRYGRACIRRMLTLRTCQQFDERRFARAVHADERYTITALDNEI